MLQQPRKPDASSEPEDAVRAMYEALLRQLQYLERVAPKELSNTPQHVPTEADRLRDQLRGAAKH